MGASGPAARRPAGARVTPTSTRRAPLRRLRPAAARAFLTFLKEIGHHQHPRRRRARLGERSRGPRAGQSRRERGRDALRALLLPLSVLLGRHDRRLSEKKQPRAAAVGEKAAPSRLNVRGTGIKLPGQRSAARRARRNAPRRSATHEAEAVSEGSRKTPFQKGRRARRRHRR